MHTIPILDFNHRFSLKNKGIILNRKIKNISGEDVAKANYQILGPLASGKERMQAGSIYSPMDTELRLERCLSQNLCRMYNNEETEPKDWIIKSLFGKIGNNFKISKGIKLDYGYNIQAGENFSAGKNLVVLDCAPVKFGDNVTLGKDCGFYTPVHPISPILRTKPDQHAMPITIGNNCKVGDNVTFIGGITVGDNVTIISNSVVTGDLPSNSICAGNPCHVQENNEILSYKTSHPFDIKLVEGSSKAQELCKKYNETLPSEQNIRQEIIKSLFGKTEKRFMFNQDFMCDYGFNIEIGNNVFSNFYPKFHDTAPIKLGNNVLIGPKCEFFTPVKWLENGEYVADYDNAEPIIVGNNCWFGGSVSVFGGVTIGDNVIIGAGSIVTQDLPSNSFCAGNPCIVKKSI